MAERKKTRLSGVHTPKEAALRGLSSPDLRRRGKQSVLEAGVRELIRPKSPMKGKVNKDAMYSATSPYKKDPVYGAFMKDDSKKKK